MAGIDNCGQLQLTTAETGLRLQILLHPIHALLTEPFDRCEFIDGFKARVVFAVINDFLGGH